MSPRVIVVEPGTAIGCRSVEEAERVVEADEVRSGLYSFYDDEGRPLRASLVPRFSGPLQRLVGQEQVVLEPASGPARPEKLREALVSYLSTDDAPVDWHRGLSLKELVDRLFALQEGNG